MNRASLLTQSFATLLIAFVQATNCYAAIVTVVNPSFESFPLTIGQFSRLIAFGAVQSSTPIPGWTFSPTFSDAGTYFPTSSDYAGGTSNGNKLAYISRTQNIVNLGLPGGQYIDQILSTTIANNTIYSLQVDVGLRTGSVFPNSAGYSVDLLAGGNLLAQDINTQSIVSGSFVTSNVTFTTNANSIYAGLPLEIRLGLVNPNSLDTQVNFDNVRLQATAIPEPSCLLLLSTASMIFLSRTDLTRRREFIRAFHSIA